MYLQYLSGLLVHRRLALDFVAAGGVELLIKINRDSPASAVVGTCLYYLAYNTDAMEGVCLLPDETLNGIVKYVKSSKDPEKYVVHKLRCSVAFIYILSGLCMIECCLCYRPHGFMYVSFNSTHPYCIKKLSNLGKET